MKSTREIKAAVKQMGLAEGEVPNIDIVRKILADDSVTSEQVAAALGLATANKEVGPAPADTASMEGNGGAPSEPAADASAAPGPGTGGAPEAPAVVPMIDAFDQVDWSTVNPKLVDADTASQVVQTAREKLAAVQNQIAAGENERVQVVLKIDRLIQRKDVLSKVIEKFADQVSFAESVRAIQKQTRERLAGQKVATAVAAEALKTSGVAIFPSQLDQALTMRKRSKEQVENYAKFVHQHAAQVRSNQA